MTPESFPANYYPDSRPTTRPRLCLVEGQYVSFLDDDQSWPIVKYPGRFVKLVEVEEAVGELIDNKPE